MDNSRQRRIARRLEWVIVALFGFLIGSLVVIYLIVPEIYTKALLQQVVAVERYTLVGLLFCLAVVVFVGILIVGVMRHWRWLFWLLLFAFCCSLLQIPAMLLQMMKILPGEGYPVWYSVFRMIVAAGMAGIGVWMIWVYRR